nr:hypothetical protein [Tanacetum cinerariifolium]
GADEELSDGGSPWVIVYGYDGLSMLPVAPPSPDYIPGLEEPQTPPAPQDKDEHELMFIQPHDPYFRTCLRHYLQSPTLLSTPILNRGEYFREPTRSYQMEVLHESSCTDTMDSLC